jgi:hypothetical protein
MENARSHVTRIASKFYFRNQLSECEQIRQSGQFNPVCDKHKMSPALWMEWPPCKTKRCKSELTTSKNLRVEYWLQVRESYSGGTIMQVSTLRIYRVIHKSLRDLRSLQYCSRDGHPEGEHVNKSRDIPSFCPTLQVLYMSTLGDATDVNFWQIPRHRTLSYSLSTPCFVTTAP